MSLASDGPGRGGADYRQSRRRDPFYGHDILGFVTARFSHQGLRMEELEYRAFGELRRAEVTTDHPYGLIGKAMDPTNWHL